jgi:hypothetical protein
MICPKILISKPEANNIVHPLSFIKKSQNKGCVSYSHHFKPVTQIKTTKTCKFSNILFTFISD